jgi:hypothetical protein
MVYVIRFFLGLFIAYFALAAQTQSYEDIRRDAERRNTNA